MRSKFLNNEIHVKSTERFYDKKFNFAKAAYNYKKCRNRCEIGRKLQNFSCEMKQLKKNVQKSLSREISEIIDSGRFEKATEL